MKQSVFTLLFFISVAAFGQQYKGDSWATVKSNGAGTLAVIYYEQPGLIYKAPDGTMKGVCVDMLSDFAKHVEKTYGKKVKVEYLGRETEFQTFLKLSYTTPNIIGVTNTSITEERKKLMQFTPPYMSTQRVMLTNKTTPPLRSLNDLPAVFKGYSAQVIEGSTHMKYAEEIKKKYYPELEIKTAPSSEVVLTNLKSNPKMFSILDFTEYIGVVRKKIPVKRQEVDLGEAEPLGFVMSKQTDWGPLFNEFLTEEYRQSIRFKQIIAENLGSSFLSLVR